MGEKVTYTECPEKATVKVAESGQKAKRDVIPFVTPERAVEIFSSQRRMSWEEMKRQIDISLGRLKDSD